MLTRLCTLCLLILIPLTGSLAMAQELPVILLVGDSLGAGYGVEQSKSWGTLLDARLKSQAPAAQLVNASISGDTTAGGLARLEPLLQREKPAWVMIELGGNDGLRGMDLEAMERNLTAMVKLTRQHNGIPLLIGIKIPPNYGRKYRERFEQVFKTVSEAQSVPLLPFLLDGVGGDTDFMQADRIHPNAAAQPVIAENVWQFLQPSIP